MPQHPRLEIGHAVAGIDEAAFGVPGDGVDGQITTLQIHFQRDVRIGVKHEARMPRCGLPLGPRQRILFAGFRMQEHRKILTNLAESHGKHVLASCADDTPVTLGGR